MSLGDYLVYKTAFNENTNGRVFIDGVGLV